MSTSGRPTAEEVRAHAHDIGARLSGHQGDQQPNWTTTDHHGQFPCPDRPEPHIVAGDGERFSERARLKVDRGGKLVHG